LPQLKVNARAVLFLKREANRPHADRLTLADHWLGIQQPQSRLIAELETMATPEGPRKKRIAAARPEEMP
jgi:hypothetical protein